jgi:hypothetical protein
MKHFVLDPDRRVIEVDLLTWGRWMGKLENRELARTQVRHLLVLTSFAGIDISFGDGPPAFFETRVLDGCDELECLESGSWDEAIAGHKALTERWTCWADGAWGAAQRALARPSR